MKYTMQISFEWLCFNFKHDPRGLEYKLKYCTYEVFVSRNTKYGCGQSFTEVNSLDDVIQCILKYK